MCFWCCLVSTARLSAEAGERWLEEGGYLRVPEIFQALIPERTVKTESRWVEECDWEGLRDDNGMEEGSGGKAQERRKY